MFVELHTIQNFAPSNLNRDANGSPKECVFGGYKRARISSQSLKRAIRTDARFEAFLAGRGGFRTRRLIIEIAQRVTAKETPSDAEIKIVSEVFATGGIVLQEPKPNQPDNHLTRIILFLDRPLLDEMVQLFKENWTTLEGGGKSAEEVRDTLGAILARQVKAPDIALFGRMIEIGGATPFGKLQLGVDGACQMAHALSTHQNGTEFDYFTAVDELQPQGELGAGMIGLAEFNSACYYRYANIDLRQLTANLKDAALARETISAFLYSAISAIPNAKQASMATPTRPSFALVVVRKDAPWSLVNAFAKPIRVSADGDLIESSIAALDGHWHELATMYGDEDILGKWLSTTKGSAIKHLAKARVDNIATIVQSVMETIDRPVGAGEA
jgi:CRISPR system Cascade subunit CasC